MVKVVHCCLCRAEHPVEKTTIGNLIVCPYAKPGELFFFNTKYFAPQCWCGVKNRN